MPRRLIGPAAALAVAFLCAGGARAALLPEEFGAYKRAEKATPADLTDKEIWQEFGLKESEKAVYRNKKGQDFRVSAYRMLDPTGAYAAFQWRRPETAKPLGRLTEMAYSAGKGGIIAYANYVVEYEGVLPAKEDLDFFYGQLPRLSQAALPPLRFYLPEDNRRPNTERYILGPASLEKFLPALTPSTVGFHLGAEGQVARFQVDGQEATLAMFEYPSPQMARERVKDFEALPNQLTKRTGPIIAMVTGISNRDSAQRFLASIRYEASITIEETVSKPPLTVGSMLMSIMVLAGILGAASIIVGFFLGGFRSLLWRFGIKDAEERLTALDLSDK